MGNSNLRLHTIRHPHHDLFFQDWEKFRLTFEGGRFFKEKYLKKFSVRESDDDFELRKSITHVPAYAKAAIIEIRNAIYQRMVDISRVGGPDSYRDAIIGLNGGVDGAGNDMDQFIGKKILPELLVLGRVGVYIDKPQLLEGLTLADLRTSKTSPYLYHYQAEDILSWHLDEFNELDAVLLRDHVFIFDEDTGLTTHRGERLRLLRKIDNTTVSLKLFKTTRGPGSSEIITVQEGDETFLELPRIPFVILELSNSLMTDIADYQISLLNLASSDMAYSLKANYPFYTEQFIPAFDVPNLRQGGVDGEADTASTGSSASVDVGVAQGRRYPKDLERPGFIHPSSEPLKASMEKQQQLKEEIRELVLLTLADTRSNNKSPDPDSNRGLEGGLAAIGLELAFGESSIAKIWADYESVNDDATIEYPDTYNLRTDADRRQEAQELKDIRPTIASPTFQRLISLEIADTMLRGKASPDDMESIQEELNEAEVYSTDPEVIQSDHMAGFVSTETASLARGYPKGEVKKAKIDHVERLARIAEAQSPDGMQRAASRGVADLDMDQENSAREEKAESRITDLQETTADRTRGEADG